jgi:hypothetical protein
VFLIEVTLPPFDKYILFHSEKQRSTFAMMSSQTNLALKEAPKGRPRYFIGKVDTLEPKILAKPSTFITLPIGTNFHLTRLILRPNHFKA